MSDVYGLVRSIRDKSWSRNRHFDEHATTNGAAARRMNRFLNGIARDLLTAREVRVEREPGRTVISMSFPSVRLTRVVALSDPERALLAEDPRLEELLA